MCASQHQGHRAEPRIVPEAWAGSDRSSAQGRAQGPELRGPSSGARAQGPARLRRYSAVSKIMRLRSAAVPIPPFAWPAWLLFRYDWKRDLVRQGKEKNKKQSAPNVTLPGRLSDRLSFVRFIRSFTRRRAQSGGPAHGANPRV